MMELIVVVVVLAILAIYSVPRMQRDERAEAINHILTMVRFTQNLALHDNMHLSDSPTWQRRFWRFQIYNCKDSSGIFYMIGKDENMNGYIDRGETATDPSNGNLHFGIQEMLVLISQHHHLEERLAQTYF